MAKQQIDSSEKSGNRKSYDGAEVLKVFWVLQEYSDEEHPLSIKQIEEKATELYGDDSVPKRKGIERCLAAIHSWAGDDAERDRVKLVDDYEKDTCQAVFHPLSAPVIGVKRVGNANCYFAERRHAGQDETAALIDCFAAFMNVLAPSGAAPSAELMPFEVENRVATAGSGVPDDACGWPVQDLLAMVRRLRAAIDQKKAISFFRVHYSVGENDTVRLEPPSNAPVDENRVAKFRWPYALKAVDGRFYVLVNGSGGRELFAPIPVDEIAELHVIDPSDPKDMNGCPIKLERRKNLDGLVDRYFDGAVFGRGSKKDKVRIDLLCKGNAFHDAYKRFALYDFEIHDKSARCREMNKIEETLRPKNNNSRKANPWHEVTFMAHPYGVQLWAEQRPRDVVMISPEANACLIKRDLADSRYDLGFTPLDNLVKLFDLRGDALPNDLLANDALSDDEKKLIAVYRVAKAKDEAEKAAKK